MGSLMSHTWFIYGRDKEDRWLDEPLASTLKKSDNIKFHMKRFKYHVFQLGLGYLDSVHKIYLYQGFRVAKCVLKDDDTMTVEFSSEAAKQAWFTCKRPATCRKFDSMYTKISDDPVVFTKNPDSQPVAH